MVTERKKRKQRLFLYLYGSVFLIIFLLISGYGIAAYLTRRPYISPLPASIAAMIYPSQGTSTATLEDLLKKKHIAYTSVVRDSNTSFFVQLKSEGEVVFSTTKGLDEQVTSLQLILSRLTIEGKGLRRLDLRFDKPVITFSK